MSKIYLTSDTHFGHSREFLYGPRGFSSIQDHDEAIIANWNAVVSPDDVVYHLGDVMLGDNEHGMECLRRLNGNIKIVRGNHDTDTRWTLYETLPNVELLGWATTLKYRKYYFYLSHFHTDTSNLDENPYLRAHMLNLYGHTHQKTSFYHDIPYYFHVGLDSNNNAPVLLDDIIEKMKVENQKCIAMNKEEIQKLIKPIADAIETEKYDLYSLDGDTIYIIPTVKDKPIKVIFET